MSLFNVREVAAGDQAATPVAVNAQQSPNISIIRSDIVAQPPALPLQERNVELLPFISLSLHDALTFSVLAYGDEEANSLSIPETWKMVNFFDGEGIHVKAYVCSSVKVGSVRHKLVFAFRGMWPGFEEQKLEDFMAVVQAIKVQAPTQFSQVIAFLNGVYNPYKKEGCSIWLVGHSLGGVYAQLATQHFKAYNASAITFDTLGCKEILKKVDPALDYSKNYIGNYILRRNLFNQMHTHCNLNFLGIDKLPASQIKKIESCEAKIKTILQLMIGANMGQKMLLAGALTATQFALLATTHAKINFMHQLGLFSPALGIVPPVKTFPISKFLIWKQDPSVSLKRHDVMIHGAISNGPSCDMLPLIIVEGVQAARVLPGDFIYDAETEANKADAVHTFGVVFKVHQMFFQICAREMIPWNGDWAIRQKPIRIVIYNESNEEYKNAHYRRSEEGGYLVFGRFLKGNKEVRMCRSFDIVAHEVGHAILDSLQPEFWHQLGNVEVRALHEAFADLTVLFALLNELDICETVVTHVRGDMSRESFLTFIGEQCGQALDFGLGLRSLIHNKRISQTPLDAYELSMVFSGAVYDILTEYYRAKYNPLYETPAKTLHEAARKVASALVFAAYNITPLNPTFKDFAKWMIDFEKDPQHKQIMSEKFKEREVTTHSISLQNNPNPLKNKIAVLCSTMPSHPLSPNREITQKVYTEEEIDFLIKVSQEMLAEKVDKPSLPKKDDLVQTDQELEKILNIIEQNKKDVAKSQHNIDELLKTVEYWQNQLDNPNNTHSFNEAQQRLQLFIEQHKQLKNQERYWKKTLQNLQGVPGQEVEEQQHLDSLLEISTQNVQADVHGFPIDLTGVVFPSIKLPHLIHRALQKGVGAIQFTGAKSSRVERIQKKQGSKTTALSLLYFPTAKFVIHCNFVFGDKKICLATATGEIRREERIDNGKLKEVEAMPLNTFFSTYWEHCNEWSVKRPAFEFVPAIFALSSTDQALLKELLT